MFCIVLFLFVSVYHSYIITTYLYMCVYITHTYKLSKKIIYIIKYIVLLFCPEAEQTCDPFRFMIPQLIDTVYI